MGHSGGLGLTNWHELLSAPLAGGRGARRPRGGRRPAHEAGQLHLVATPVGPPSGSVLAIAFHPAGHVISPARARPTICNAGGPTANAGDSGGARARTRPQVRGFATPDVRLMDARSAPWSGCRATTVRQQWPSRTTREPGRPPSAVMEVCDHLQRQGRAAPADSRLPSAAVGVYAAQPGAHAVWPAARGSGCIRVRGPACARTHW